MAIDASIALGIKPVQIENPLNNMAKFYNIQNDMANMARHRQQTEAATAAAARQGELDRYLAGGGRDESIIYGLGGVKDLAELRQGETAKRLGEKTEGETLDAAIKRGRGLFQDFVHTPQDARQFTYMQFTDPVIKKYMASLGVSFDQAMARIPNDPAEFRKYKQQYVVGMEKHLENLAVKNITPSGDRNVLTDSEGKIIGEIPIGATMEQRINTDPAVLAGIANQDALKQQIAQGNPGGQAPVASQATQLLNASVAQANDQTPPPISPLAANVNRQQAELAAVNTKLRADQERALAAKQNPEAKLAAINDYYARINNGEDPNSPSMKVRKGQIDFNQTRAEPMPFMVLNKTGDLTGVDKRTMLPVGTLKGVGKPQQNIVQFGPDGQPIQDKALPAHAIEVQAKNAAGRVNIQNSVKDVLAHPEAFGLQNILPETLRQKLDPAGVDARAGVANIGSMIVHDRSGAAVTVGEVPRLRPFIPDITYDDGPAIIAKLRKLDKIMGEMNLEMSKSFAAQGYNTGAGAPPPAEPTLHKHPKTKGRDTTNPLL